MASKYLTPTAEQLRAVFHYEPNTGIVTWREDSPPKQQGKLHKAGDAFGSVDRESGRLVGRVGGRMWPLHRLIWCMVTGAMPDGIIDHKDGDGLNNRWLNLRDTTQGVNVQNLRRAHRDRKHSLPLGVSLISGAHRSKPYRARIKVNGTCRVLGAFKTPEEAYEVYLETKRLLHLGCTI